MSTQPAENLHHENSVEGSESQQLALHRSLSGNVSIAENTVLQQALPEDELPGHGKAAVSAKSITWVPVRYLLLLCGFLTSLSFSVTQVPLLFAFRLMTCDGYYKTHSGQQQNSVLVRRLSNLTLSVDISQMVSLNLLKDFQSTGDRCAIPAIDTSTALSYSLLGASTTTFGIVNLFLAGILIKRIGVQRTLIVQIFFPAVRLLVQNIGVEVGGYTGILIVQCSQAVNIVGGPSGYILALNQFITDVVSHEERTASLGKMAGATLFGSAFGFLIGGLLAEAFTIKTPFRVTLALFLVSTTYVILFLPYVPPATVTNDVSQSNVQSQSGIRSKLRSQLLGPLLVFKPRKFLLSNSEVRREYGASLVACGVFMGIVATGYIPYMLQLFSTDVFHFGARENGWLIFMYALLRGVFLSFAFPRIIAFGRNVIANRAGSKQAPIANTADQSQPEERQPLLNNQHSNSESVIRQNTDKSHIYTFDLAYTRLSILTDGILTLCCTFLRQGWQMYLVAAILPFAAGTGSAAKGTVLEILGASASSNERTDALAGISLVENLARLTTSSVFGPIFAAFTSIGRPELTYTVNAACALLAFSVLLFARFPPSGSIRLDHTDASKASLDGSSEA